MLFRSLWRTDRVKLLISQVYKSLRTAMTLLEDNVDQQTALTPQQRVIVRAIADGVLTESRELIENEFATWSPIDDHDDDGLK